MSKLCVQVTAHLGTLISLTFPYGNSFKLSRDQIGVLFSENMSLGCVKYKKNCALGLLLWGSEKRLRHAHW